MTQSSAAKPTIRVAKCASGTDRAGTAREAVAIGPRAVDRAAAILLSFSFRQPSLSLAQLAQAAQLPKPSAYRIVSALVANGLVRQAQDGRYEPGFRLFELGAIVQSRLVLAQVAADAVQTLANETGETVLLSQVDWATGEQVIVAKAEAIHPVGVLAPLGRRSRISPGCLGKAVLAGLPPEALPAELARLSLPAHTTRTIANRRTLRREIEATRQRGFALDQEEYLVGVAGVGSWLHLGDPRPVGALGVVGPTQRLPEAHLLEIGERVAALCRALSFTRPATAGA